MNDFGAQDSTHKYTVMPNDAQLLEGNSNKARNYKHSLSEDDDLIKAAPIMLIKEKLFKKLEAEKERMSKSRADLSFDGSQIETAIGLLSSLNPEKIVLQLTSSHSAFFRLYTGAYELHLELFLGAENGMSAQTMFIVYFNDDAIVTGSRGLSEAFALIKNTLSQVVHPIFSE
jgi:hypothetical protein